MRLGQQGHQGLGQALAEIGEDFVDRVAGDRPGGRQAAQAERNDAVQGALGIVLEAGYGLAPYACCPCLIAEFRRAVEGNAAFTPRGKRNERKVLRFLLKWAEYRGSLRVTESQRQIAEAIDVQQPRVSKILKRLQDQGWLTVMTPATPWTPATYHLHLPEVCKGVSTRSPAGPRVLG